ncbi:MAG: lipoyl(octanoyl) transferase LipB [Desulforhopalus sp.]
MESGRTTARIVDLGVTDYAAAYALQLELVEKRRKGTVVDDLFLITEHPGTFTLGRRGGRENLMVSEQFLRDKKIPLVHIERGGDITYHGRGQLVMYPIIHLRQTGLTVSLYVHLLEEIMIRLAAAVGVSAVRDPRNHGVWVGDRKLGSIGIAIRHGVAFHGLALNINISLEPFSWVNPCGLAGVQMTNLCCESGRDVAFGEVKKHLLEQLTQLFSREFVPLEKDKLDVSIYKQNSDGQTEMAQA